MLFPFIVSGICIGLILLIINSTYGRAFKAIRDDEVAAEAMGVNLFHHKELAFVISCFFAGIGGALLAMFQGTVQANSFKSAMTYDILLMVVIGCVLGGLSLSQIWGLFGAANQLLAGIALMAVAAWLGEVGKNNKMF